MGRENVGRLVHDLRNPIGVLSGFAHLLTEKTDRLSPDQIKHIGEGVQKSVDRLAEIIEDISEPQSRT